MTADPGLPVPSEHKVPPNVNGTAIDGPPSLPLDAPLGPVTSTPRELRLVS
jgi:hypothetical protein